MNAAAVELNLVVVTIFVPVPARSLPACIDKRVESSGEYGHDIGRSKIAELLATGHSSHQTRSVIDPDIRRPACLDCEHLKIVCHLTRRGVYDAMVERPMCRAVSLDYCLKEDTNYIGSPLLNHRRNSLVVRVSQIGEHVT